MALTKISAAVLKTGIITVNHLHTSHGITTSNIGEGSNLFYTDARVSGYLSTNSYATQSYVGTQISALGALASLNTIGDSYIVDLAWSKITGAPAFITGITNITGNAGTVTDGVYTTGSYANPAWITSLAYSKITGVPATFAPSAHSHVISDVTGLQTALNSKQATLGGTGFVKSTAGVISYDTSTYYLASNPSGFTSNTGTVTSIGGTGTVSGLTLTGTVTTSGNLTLGGTLTLTSGNVTTALGFTPYNATNPAGYITSYVNTTYTAGSGLLLSGTTFRLNGGEIASGVDLNTMRTTGVFSQNSNADATAGTNWPTNNAGMLEVWNDDYGNGIHCTQRYSQYNTTDVYNRNYYNGTWTAWRNLTQDTDTVYVLPFTNNSTNWNTAYGWGNHASAGYLTSHQSLSGYLPLGGGTLTGNLDTSGNSNHIIIGGVASNNHYNAVTSTTGLSFGGGNDFTNYSIGTTSENFGGNYTKLNIKWHTGIRFFAMPQYGGVRFYSDVGLATKLFSIGEGDAHVRVSNNLYTTGTVTGSNLSGTNTGDQTNISGNAATVTVNSGNTSAGWYPITWHSGNTVYSSSGVEIYAAGNYIRAQYINTTDNLESGITRFVIKNGDEYHRSATTTTAADIIRGVASGTWGISISGNAATATTATTTTGNAATATTATTASGQTSGSHFSLNNGGGGYGLVGGYNPDIHQGLFAMGSSYTLTAGGGLGNFYGVSWSYDYSGRQLNTGYNLQHCMAVANNGTVYSVIGLGIWTSGLIRANGAISAGGTITASNFSGTHSGSSSGTNTGDQTNISGNAATATRTSGNSGYAHAGTGMYAFYNWGGSNGGGSAPTSSSYTTGISVGSHPGDQAYGFQIANNMWNTGLWTRNYNSGFGSWVKLIDSSTIGSQSVNYATSAGSATTATNLGTGTVTITGEKHFQTNNGTAAVLNSNSASLTAHSTGNNSAFMSFHRSGYYAINMGLDADNHFRIGGWSAGTTSRFTLNMGNGDLTMGGFIKAPADIYRMLYSSTFTRWIALSGDLSGQVANTYPTLKTNYTNLYFDAGGVYTGYIGANTGFIDNSDLSLKENIEDIPDALSKVMGLKGRYFTWIDELQNNERQAGFIAQEVEEYFPEVVDVGAGGLKGVAYGKITALLVNAIKEQQAQIELLKQEIELLKQ